MKQTLKNWIDDVLGRKTYRRYGEEEKRKRRIIGQLFTIAVFIAAMYYLTWCIIHAQWQYWYMTIPFLISEFVFLILFLLWANILWNKRYHRPMGPPLERKNFSVDVFIPVCREPVDIVEETVAAAASIDYDNKEVYVLDDGGDDAVKALSEKHGVHYFRRPSHENSKAGNLNYALKRTNGDLILAIDADQVARPEIIDRIIGYFTLPKIGFVQTKQSFKLPEGDPWGSADEVFYKVMQPGKDYDNAAISCGNGVMYRRAAIETIKGFSIWNLVEDLHTSMMLHSKGWKSVYHGEAYTKGTAPEEVISYETQRRQWAIDSLRILFWNNPLFIKGLSFHQRLQYFHFGYNYIAFGIFLPIFFILPICALFTYQFMLPEPLWHYVLARLPYFLLYLISNQITTDKIHSFKVFQAQAGLFATYFHAFFTALFSRKRVPQYKVTRKIALQPDIWSRLSRCMPHIIFVLLSIFASVYGFLTIRHDSWFLIINVFWAFWTITVVGRFIVMSLWPKRLLR